MKQPWEYASAAEEIKALRVRIAELEEDNRLQRAEQEAWAKRVAELEEGLRREQALHDQHHGADLPWYQKHHDAPFEDVETRA